jgi:membrane protease YdiL (CAAX protease family)
MSDVLPPPESPPARRPRGQALLAWVVILAACTYLVWRNARAPAGESLPQLDPDALRHKPVVLLLGLGMFLAGGAGLFLLVTWVVLVAVGRLQLRLRAFPQYGAIYAETFAVWMLLFVGLAYGVSWLPARGSGPLLSALAMVLSLSALAWPVLRGVPWQRVRHDLGLHAGANPPAEVACGLGCYAAALALAFAGALVMFVLIAIRRKLSGGAPDTLPSHPAAEWVVEGNWWVRVQVIFAAVVVAPLVEETMFRGVLYRHLREGLSRGHRVASVLLSTLVTSFVFAVIHPQGWLGVPPLMGIATAFTLTREWRGSLLPCMLAHGLHNGVIMTLAIGLYS